jgi:radical SAM protein with 4Fe4S-binding SPASM domain
VSTMQYYVIQQGKKSLILTKRPYTWFSVDQRYCSDVVRLLYEGSEKLKNLFAQNEVAWIQPSPRHLAMYPVIKLTNRCNLNCSHCYIEAHDSMLGGKCDLQYEDIVHFIDYVKRLGGDLGEPTLTVQLFGGEPTLHKQFSEIVRYCRDQQLYVRVSTNAANVKLFQSGQYDELFMDRMVEWRVSLESHIQEVHDIIRPSSYHKVVSNLRYMAERNANISVKTVVGTHNFEHFEDIIYFCRNIGATDYLYSPLSLTGAALKNGLANRITTLMINKKVIDVVERDGAVAPFLRASPLARYLKLIYLKESSVLPRVQYFVNHDGRICPQDNLYESPQFHFGDIHKRDYAYDILVQHQKRFETDLIACQSCPVEPYCPKGDYAQMAADDGNITKPFSVCDDIREVIYYLMSLGDRGLALTEAFYGSST